MPTNQKDPWIAGPGDTLLVTGATGFIGAKVVENLLERGFRRIRCFARPLSNTRAIVDMARRRYGVELEIVTGNLLVQEDCIRAVRNVSVIYHLAAGTGQKSFPDAFMNSVVTTRNLLVAAGQSGELQRFVCVSSFAVYSNMGKRRNRTLDESCPVDPQPERRGEAYCFAKIKQEEIVREYCANAGIPYVLLRPGYVYGPEKPGITSRVGIDTFGMFLHLGGGNQIPFSYVDNCADAIALAGLRNGIDNETFNVVDDGLLSSRKFLSLYKKHVTNFHSLYLPHWLSYALCYLWERYSAWSEEQIPPAFNRRRWSAYWRNTRYSNAKLKTLVGWSPKVSTTEGLQLYFKGCRNARQHA